MNDALGLCMRNNFSNTLKITQIGSIGLPGIIAVLLRHDTALANKANDLMALGC